ncbi:MAG: hypothetical protein WC284_08415 [Candidimonas sp.]
MKKADQKFVCNFCNRSFAKETTMARHMCAKKNRWLRRDDRDVKIAYYAFDRFCSKALKTKKEKTYREFCDSSLWGAFVRFGKFFIDNNCVCRYEFYVDWLIKYAVPVDDWNKEQIYLKYLNDYVKVETPDQAVTRTIKLMETWAVETGNDWRKFFDLLSVPMALQMVKWHKLSPWVLFLSDGGKRLLERFSPEQQQLLSSYVDIPYWLKKFQIEKNDVDYFMKLFEKYAL